MGPEGAPPTERHFHRQNAQNPNRRHRSRVAGFAMIMAFRMAGTIPDIQVRKARSAPVSLILPRYFRRSTITWCRRTTFSATCRRRDFNAETMKKNRTRKKLIIPIGITRDPSEIQAGRSNWKGYL